MHRHAPRRPRTVLAAALLLAVTGLAGCGGTNLVPGTVRPEGVQQVSPNLADLRPYLGREVTVTADIAAVKSPRGFTIVEQEGGGGEPLLVVHESPDPIDDDLSITVTGTVGIFDAQTNLVGEQDPARLTQYDGKPYIEATRLVAPNR